MSCETDGDLDYLSERECVCACVLVCMGGCVRSGRDRETKECKKPRKAEQKKFSRFLCQIATIIMSR